MPLTIAIVVVILVAAFLGFVASKPNDFRIQRTKRIKAAPEAIVENISDFRKWAAWSPYEKLDPAMKRTLSGAPSGTGSVYEWEGNSKAGMGRMEIIDVKPPTKVTIKLDFMKPFTAHNTAEFTLERNGEFTDVTWAMYGQSPFVAKAMGVVFNMDKMVGKDFDTGLTNLKTLAER